MSLANTILEIGESKVFFNKKCQFFTPSALTFVFQCCKLVGLKWVQKKARTIEFQCVRLTVEPVFFKKGKLSLTAVGAGRPSVNVEGASGRVISAVVT